MTIFRRGNLESVAWALRRLYCPVPENALVLEVGSGGNPYARSNVLLDAYEATRERHWAPLSADRPTVLGFAENLPFRDQSFDFVIAAHVLEHYAQPELFLSELQRVAKAGYIEVPDAFLERVNPYRDHRLEVTSRNGTLVIQKKGNWVGDPSVVELYENRVKPRLTGNLVPKFPFDFHVRHYWEHTIAFRVINPEVDAGWPSPTSTSLENPTPKGPEAGVRIRLRDLLRWAMSQRRRNASIDVLHVLRCTACHASDLKRRPADLQCMTCGTIYPVRNNIAAMNEGRLHE